MEYVTIFPFLSIYYSLLRFAFHSFIILMVELEIIWKFIFRENEREREGEMFVIQS